jgi:light-regulated signal transduction histidine kinase (bacteriophytochrome)
MREVYSAKNNSVTTIQNCADKPIHIPGSIQPHGFTEKIFKVFQRGHYIESLGGTGIGLAICRKIMENHGGAIEAESRGEAGACFHLYFNYGPVDN